MNNKKTKENKISIKQIKTDLKTLEVEFLKMAGAWEYNDGDYGCISIAEQELKLCKAIAERYPFEYKYNPNDFDKNPNDLGEDWADIIFDFDDFENNNVNQNNYIKVDAVACDFQSELIGMLKQLKDELEWLPPRFREEFIVDVICNCPQNRYSIRKNCEFFIDEIYNELTKKEINKMFITL